MYNYSPLTLMEYWNYANLFKLEYVWKSYYSLGNCRFHMRLLEDNWFLTLLIRLMKAICISDLIGQIGLLGFYLSSILHLWLKRWICSGRILLLQYAEGFPFVDGYGVWVHDVSASVMMYSMTSPCIPHMLHRHREAEAYCRKYIYLNS